MTISNIELIVFAFKIDLIDAVFIGDRPGSVESKVIGDLMQRQFVAANARNRIGGMTAIAGL